MDGNFQLKRRKQKGKAQLLTSTDNGVFCPSNNELNIWGSLEDVEEFVNEDYVSKDEVI